MRLRNRAPRNPYKRTAYGGHTVNWRTRAMLMKMSETLYGKPYELTVYQGSYNTGVSASAGTHDGGGAVDLSPNDWRKKVHEGRAIGFAIWHRTEAQGDWDEHCHGIAIGDKEMSSGAHSQVIAYGDHRDGLADDAWDPFPFHPRNVFNYQAWRKHYNK